MLLLLQRQKKTYIYRYIEIYREKNWFKARAAMCVMSPLAQARSPALFFPSFWWCSVQVCCVQFRWPSRSLTRPQDGRMLARTTASADVDCHAAFALASTGSRRRARGASTLLLLTPATHSRLTRVHRHLPRRTLFRTFRKLSP